MLNGYKVLLFFIVLITFFSICSNDKQLLTSAAMAEDTQQYYKSDSIKFSYPIVDTGVKDFYSDSGMLYEPVEGEDYFGQDAHYQGKIPAYTDNGDGTITDNVTGLVWQKDMGVKMTFEEAFLKAEELELAGYNDWRVPTIKELYSLIQFIGSVQGEKAKDLFIDTYYFIQPLGDTSIGEREIDAQTWSSTEYVRRTMNNDETVFGVNFIDGRIKGYPKYNPRTKAANKMYFRFVRGNTEYGKNSFIDNGDGTISDLATGLMWQKADDGVARDWKESLEYAEALELVGYTDWKLPNAKELQSIIDYSRSKQTTNTAAIDPIFNTSKITDPNGNENYPYFWTSTTHMDGINPYKPAVYIAFGEAQGKMNNVVMDVHGAGAQRSDPKSGNISEYPQFIGPQGDVRYVYNYVRCVRDIVNSSNNNGFTGKILNAHISDLEVSFDIFSEADGTYDIFIASYGENRRLISVTKETIELNEGELKAFRLGIASNTNEVKILYWQSGTMKPVAISKKL